MREKKNNERKKYSSVVTITERENKFSDSLNYLPLFKYILILL
jgi:hypothetical protein